MVKQEVGWRNIRVNFAYGEKVIFLVRTCFSVKSKKGYGIPNRRALHQALVKRGQ